MSKLGKTTYERSARDFYPTPHAPVQQLLPYLEPGTRFVEPCAGAYDLAGHLEQAGHICTLATDLEPRDDRVIEADGKWIGAGPELLITNPPFARTMVVPLLQAWMGHGRMTWLLLPSDMLMNGYFQQFAGNVRRIVPIGRIRWIEGSPSLSTDNFAWTQLDPAGGFDWFAPRFKVKETTPRKRRTGGKEGGRGGGTPSEHDLPGKMASGEALDPIAA